MSSLLPFHTPANHPTFVQIASDPFFAGPVDCRSTRLDQPRNRREPGAFHGSPESYLLSRSVCEQWLHTPVNKPIVDSHLAWPEIENTTMSVVTSLPRHQSLSDHDRYISSAAVSAYDQLPPSQETGQPLIPFPIFQNRHSSPYPILQSFSALGPPELPPSVDLLASVPPPPAPRLAPLTLPSNAPDGSDLSMIQTPLPPTPDPSPPSSKILLPTTMIKLAPPAEASSPPQGEVKGQPGDRSTNDTPRRLPTISIDTLHDNALPAGHQSGPSARLRTQSQLQGPRSSVDTPPARAKSMGPARVIRRSQTAIHASSLRMIEGESADPRIRSRSRAHVPRRSSTQIRAFAAESSHSLPRASTDSAVTPGMGDLDGLEAKVVLLGSQGVGKTSLILRYTTRLFSLSPAAATIGSSLHTRKLVHSGVRVKLQIWDTAGQERFRSMAPIYYRGAHVCVLVYDVADRTSFEDVRGWLEELGKTVPKETVIFVVGSKVDLVSQRTVR